MVSGTTTVLITTTTVLITVTTAFITTYLMATALSQVAKTCNALNSETRWMVSGTPLYTSIDDLNGELAFLGVFPFCLDDKVDTHPALIG